MLFAHDTEVALAAAAALINTGRGGTELLPDVAALDRFVRAQGWTGTRTHDQAELDAVGAAGLVNSLLREAGALPQLVRHDDWDYHIHATPPTAPLADRMAVEAAMAFTDLIRTRQLGRLRRCAADGCDNVHVDLSKNSSRRFCGSACANRTNVAAYRSRRARVPGGGKLTPQRGSPGELAGTPGRAP